FSAGSSQISEPRLSNPAGYGSGEPAGVGRVTRAGGFGDAPLGASTGSGRNGDSREHRRPSYLLEQDTNAIVGELPRTATRSSEPTTITDDSVLLLPNCDEVGCGVEGVAAWWPAEPGWWVELWDAGGHVDPPVGMVDQSVMPTA
ncbi:MAG: hypothetical protein ACRDQU_01865, partial [Pseudonocardiaceae bacterium]